MRGRGHRVVCRYAAADLFDVVGRTLDVVRRMGLELRALRATGRRGHGLVLMDLGALAPSRLEAVSARLRQIPTIASVRSRPARRQRTAAPSPLVVP